MTSGAFVLAASMSCSILNREGPDTTCASLDGGAVNACHDGIIAACSGGRVTYAICDRESACEEAWQQRGAYRCAPSEPVPGLTDARDGGGGGDTDAAQAQAPSACDAGCAVVTLQSAPSALAAFGDDLFYCAEATVWRVRKTGGAPRRIGDVVGRCSELLVVDEANVWLKSADATSSIVSVPTLGESPSVTYEDTRGVATFGIDAENVYWIDSSAAVQRGEKAFIQSPKRLGGPATFRGAQLQVDTGRVFWLSPNGLASLPVDGGQIESIDLPEMPTSFRIADGAMYWTAPMRGVLRTAVRSGDSVPLTPADVSATSVALSSDFVYWAESARIARVSKSGGRAETVAAEGASILTTDDSGVYWYANGQLRRASP
jgi:hypothetical protein